MRADRPLHAPLDECIDDLLRTGEWTAPNDRSGSAEITSLMEVAAQLVDLARHTPPPDEGRKRGIWRKLITARAQLRDARSLRLALLLGDAAGFSGSNLARGGCRPLREVLP